MNKLLITTALLTSVFTTNAFAKHVIFYDNNQAYEKATGHTINQFQESPYIKSHMKNLPSVNVRLKGLDPLIEKPIDRIGIYGGQVNVLTMLPASGQDTIGFMPMERLFGLQPDNSNMRPSVAQSYTLSKDAKTIVVTLRKGIKWSDGVPLTTQEIYDWYKYINLGLHTHFMGDCTIKRIDDLRFSITFKKANVFSPYLLADWGGAGIIRPFHYIKKFIPKFNHNVKKEAEKAGYKTTDMYLKAQVSSFSAAPSSLKTVINVPTISAYVLTSKSNSSWTFTRNPYYWKVDVKGNQLPYIDKIQVKLVNNPQIIVAKVISGAVDYSQYNNITSNITIYKQNEKRGHYKTSIWNYAYSSQPILSFNLSYNGPDKVGAKIVKDIRFRRAFSIMIDRNKINDTLYYGKGTPTQMTVHNTSRFYNPVYAKVDMKYDLKKANKLLDDMGLKWDSRHKYRLRPDGKKLILFMPVSNEGGSNSLVLEMIQSSAQKVGIGINMKETEWATLVSGRLNGNKYLLDSDFSSAIDPVVWSNPKLFVPYTNDDNKDLWGMNYAKWLYTHENKLPPEGIEPPSYVKDLYYTHIKLLATKDPAQQKILAQKILKAQADNLFNIGIIANPPVPVTARDNIVNVDPHAFVTPDNKWASNYAPESRFLKPPLYKTQIVH